MRTHPGGRFGYEVLDDRTRVVYADGLEFEYSPSRKTALVWTSKSPCLSLSHQIIDSVIPLVLSMHNPLVFHGAGLVIGAEGVAVLGDSMAGKSTLAAYWVSQGRQFLSDDWFCLDVKTEAVLITPSHPSIRLRNLDRTLVDLSAVPSREWSDGYVKYWYEFYPGMGAFPTQTFPVRKVVAYRRSDEAAHAYSRTLPPGEAFSCLLSHLVLLDLHGKDSWDRALADLRRVLERVAVEELVVPGGRVGLREFSAWAERLS